MPRCFSSTKDPRHDPLVIRRVRCSRAVTHDTLLARYNDLASVAALCQAQAGKIAAVIVEPIAGNMGLVPPADGFLSGLRDLCSRHGILLIFDEVISGFRASAGGAQAIFGIQPDLTCLGKIIGGGLPSAPTAAGPTSWRWSPPRALLPGGNALRQPIAMTAGLGARASVAELYKELARRGSILARPRGGGARRESPAPGECLRLAPDAVFQRRAGARLRLRAQLQHFRLRTFFRGMLTRGVYPPRRSSRHGSSPRRTRSGCKEDDRGREGAMKDVARTI